MFVTILSLIIIAIANAEMDVIKFHPSKALFKSDWWTENGNVNRTWLMKVPLSMLLDGWHFCKFVMRLTECLLFAYLLGFSGIVLSIVAVLFYGFIGAVFELVYNRN